MLPSNRIAVVTGGNKGIGYFIALHLGLSGLFSKIILGCRDPQRGLAAANELQLKMQGSSDTMFQYVRLTIGDSESHSNFCQQMEQEFGKVDVLVNNAGFAYKGSDPTPFKEQTQKTLEVNYFGLVDFTERMLPLLRRGKDARLVSVASLSGRLSQVSNDLQKRFTDESLTIAQLHVLMNEFKEDVKAGTHKNNGWSNSNYGISKLGVIAATNIWARQESSMKVNSCCPGYCATDMSSHKGPRPPIEGAKNAVIPATIQDPPSGAFFSEYKEVKWYN